eukprot:Skav208828  [mRNA]  locus=scaffold667:377789:378373:+ [translate_table: standard]
MPWFEAGVSVGEPPPIKRGDVLELAVRDDGGKPQGTILVGVLEEAGEHKKGKVLRAMFLGAGDLYCHWWITSGEGAPAKDCGNYHLCRVPSAKCPDNAKYPNLVHSEKFRNLGTGEITAKRVAWLKDRIINDGYKFCRRKFEGVVRPSKSPKRTKASEKPSASTAKAAWAGEAGEKSGDEEDYSEGEEERGSRD